MNGWGQLGFAAGNLTRRAFQEKAKLQVDPSVELGNDKLQETVNKLKHENFQLGLTQHLETNRQIALSIRDSLNNYTKTKNFDYLNHELKINPNLKARFKDTLNILSVEPFDASNNDNLELLESSGLLDDSVKEALNNKVEPIVADSEGSTENIVDIDIDDDEQLLDVNDEPLDDNTTTTLSGDALAKFNHGYMIINDKDGGKRVVKVEDLAKTVGFEQIASKSEADNLYKVLEESANIGKNINESQVKSKLAKEYFAKPENKDKTWHDFEVDKLGKRDTEQELKAQAIHKLMQKEHLSFRDAEARVSKEVVKKEPTEQELKAQAIHKLMQKEHLSFRDAEARVSKEVVKKEPTITNASLKSELIDLEIKKSHNKLTDDELTRYNKLNDELSSDHDKDNILIKKSAKIVDKYRDNLFSSEIDVNDVSNSQLYAKETKYKPNAVANKNFKQQYNTLVNGKDLEKSINSLGNEELSRGIRDRGIKTMFEYFSDDAFKAKSPETKKKILLAIKTDTQLGMFLASYVKSISGTAVAKAEFDRLSDLFSGNGFKNIQTLKTRISAFVGELDGQFRRTAQTSLNDDTGTTLDLVRRYQRNYGVDKPDKAENDKPNKAESDNVAKANYVSSQKLKAKTLRDSGKYESVAIDAGGNIIVLVNNKWEKAQ